MADLSHLPEQWRRSGLTQREFCERRGIAVATFAYWRRKQLRGELPSPVIADTPLVAPAFTEVVVAPEPEPRVEARASSRATSAIEIVYADGTTVRIPVPAVALRAAPLQPC